MEKNERTSQREKQYQNQFEEYRILGRQKNEIEAKMDKVKENVAGMLHEDQSNEQIVELSNGERWKGAYQTTTKSSTDLKLLMETVGPKTYGEIVTQKPSTFLTIRKAGKEKKDTTLIHEKPVENDINKPFVPGGIVLS